MPQKFRKLPVVIEALQFTKENMDKLQAFVTVPKTLYWADNIAPEIRIKTLEGWMLGSAGDWIIKGVNGEFYLCKPDIFAKTYEPA